MKPSTVPEEPVELPLDAWLYEARPKAGCARCEEAFRNLNRAAKSGDASACFEAARTIRQCAHGGAGDRTRAAGT